MFDHGESGKEPVNRKVRTTIDEEKAIDFFALLQEIMRVYLAILIVHDLEMQV